MPDRTCPVIEYKKNNSEMVFYSWPKPYPFALPILIKRDYFSLVKSLFKLFKRSDVYLNEFKGFKIEKIGTSCKKAVSRE